ANESKSARERADEIIRITREARPLINSRKYKEAIALLQPAMQRFPNEEGIRSLHEKVREEMDAARVAESAQQEVAITDKPTSRPVVTLAPAPAPPTSPAPPPSQVQRPASFLPKYIGIAAVAATLIFGGVYFIANKKPALSGVSVLVRVSPAGAIVTVGDQTCQQADCKFALPRGKYEVSARLPGYESASQAVTVDAADLNLSMALTPLLTKIQIATNLETGSVTLDGKPAGPLQAGTFRAEGIAAGRHSLKITGPESAEASFQFESEPGRLPNLIGKVFAKEVDALVVANLDSRADLFTADATRAVSVAGRNVPVNSSGVRAINSLGSGAHEIKVGGADGPVYLLNTGPAPSMTVFLEAHRDTGTLLVQTRQDGTVVFIDNRRYSRLTEQGVISIPLPARKYAVRVEKPGFESPAAQQVQIARSRVNRIAFNLLPLRRFQGTPAEVPSAPPYTPATAPVEVARQPPVTVTPTDARDWESLKDSRDVTALESFRRKHPTGTFSEQALHRLEEIRKQQDDIARRQKEQAEAALRLRDAERLKAADAEKKNEETQAIRVAIEQYARAFESKKLERLLAVWPGMPGQTQNTLKRTFKDAKSISLRLSPD
ncbi:MAG: PEGA domain-containing protein, partial [Bryobacteraceae bacterium]|nr:PEGA domain-containing protein [Bryobacteraceae bacterium]